MNQEARTGELAAGLALLTVVPYVDLLRVLAHPVRLAALQTLADSPDYARSLAALLKRPENMVSRNLGALAGAGLVRYEQHGKKVIYHLSPSVCVSPQRECVELQIMKEGVLFLDMFLPPPPWKDSASTTPRRKIHGRVRRRER